MAILRYIRTMRMLLSEPTVSYCESALEGVVRRPWYAFSNIAFFIAAFAIYKNGRDRKLKSIFITTSLIVGLCSLVYDIAYTYLSQLFDLGAMFVFVSILLYLNLTEIISRRVAQLILITSGILAAISVVQLGGFAGNIIFGAYVLGIVVTESYLLATKRHKNAKLWWITFSIFLAGFGMWLFDASKTLCFDFGLLNGRALFHYTSALVIFLMFMFYESQRIAQDKRR